MNRQMVSWLFAVAGMASGIAHTQTLSAPIEDEVRQRLRISTDIQPLSENPFGERVNLSTGAFGFEQTDIELKGTGPDIRLTRSYSVTDDSAPYWRAFQDWRLEIPRIETITTPSQTAFFINSAKGRCSNIAGDGPMPITLPPTGHGTLMVGLDPQAWWYGFHLLMPGQGSQDLILPGAQNKRALPQVTLSSGRSVQATMFTKSNIAVGCLPSTANGAPGEGFLVITPDGTKYSLDWLVYKRMLTYGVPPQSIDRNLAVMLVSRVEDRFGNSVVYSYDGYGNLTRVSASDGRQLIIDYQNFGSTGMPGVANGDPDYRVTSAKVVASDGTTRTWNYSYDSTSATLSRVALPDGSAWTYALLAFRAIGGDPTNLHMINYALSTPCAYELHPERAMTLKGSMTHPSGLTGTFTARNTIRGESYVPKACAYSGSTAYLADRNVMSYSALVQKTLSGAGLPNQSWNYSYSAPNQSWDTDNCAKNNSCATTTYTDVADPDGNTVRYTFSNRFDATEGQLLSTTYYRGAAGSVVLRNQRHTYASPDAGAWPTVLGVSLGGSANYLLNRSLTPLTQSQTVQDGDTYTLQNLDFDEFTKPTYVKRFNSVAGQPVMEEKTSYLNETRQWVLGLPLQVENVGTKEVVDKYDYSADKVTLAKRWHFGQAVMTYAFDSQGNLSSFTDGNSRTTSLTSYKRGVPQNIRYADGATERRVVDDFGQIRSATDASGATTTYDYDPVGRIGRITYPSGDAVAWSPQVFNYVFLTTAERGIAGGHWKRTVSEGGARHVTYFDAKLQPMLQDTFVDGGSAHSNTRTDFNWRGQNTFTSYPVDGQPDYGAISQGATRVYDALGRVSASGEDSELGLLMTATEYLSGLKTRVTNPRGQVTTTSYMAYDAPAYEWPILLQSPEGTQTAIKRNVFADPLDVTRSGPEG